MNIGVFSVLTLSSLCCSSARFEGSLNMDLNEIAMNLVPYPRLHYLVPSLTPLYTLADVSVPTRRSAVWLTVIFYPTVALNAAVLSSDELHHSLNTCLMVTGEMNEQGPLPVMSDLVPVH